MNGVKTILQAVPTFLPKLVPVGLLVLGLILGFVWAYGLSPMVYTAAEPVNLGESWKQEYIKQVAWQFAASNDQDSARRQLSYLGNAPKIIDDMLKSPSGIDPALGPKLNAIQPLASDNPAVLSKVTPGLMNSNLTPFLCVIGLALIVGVLIIFNTLIPFSLLFGRASKGPTTVAAGQEKERRDTLARAAEQRTDFVKAAPDRGKPVTQQLSTYLLNDDVYDDFFAIETDSGEFLGEMGAGISKVLGTGSPKKVTAIEAWVFDKNDIKTVTKVLMSDYAFGDEGLRSELAAKGEPVQAKPGSITLLETTTLTVQVRIVDMAYGTGSLPPNSFFERLTLEIAAWPKKAPAAAPAPAGGFAAPPLPPSSAFPPGGFPPPPPTNNPFSGDTGKFPS